jgi:hypothetical protein
MTPLEYGLTQVTYTVTGTAEVLGIGRQRVFEEIKKKNFHPIKPGKKNLILAIEIAALLDKWRAEPTKQYLVKRATAKKTKLTLEDIGQTNLHLTPEELEQLVL